MRRWPALAIVLLAFGAGGCGSGSDASGYLSEDECRARVPGQHAVLRVVVLPVLSGTDATDLDYSDGCDSGTDASLEWSVPADSDLLLDRFRDAGWTDTPPDPTGFDDAVSLVRKVGEAEVVVSGYCDEYECGGSAEADCNPDPTCPSALRSE
ncbi:MAG: hypothetical protein ACT4P1_00910 [Sporichthyaceae bacterium]